MKIEPKAFLAIERSMAAAMHAEWDRLASSVFVKLREKLEAKDWAGAETLANELTLKGVVQSVRPKLEELATSALLFGAHRVTGDVSTTKFTKGKVIPKELHTAIDQLEHAIEHDASDFVRKQLHGKIAAMKVADPRAHMQKDSIYDEPSKRPDRQTDEEYPPEPDEDGETARAQEKLYGQAGYAAKDDLSTEQLAETGGLLEPEQSEKSRKLRTKKSVVETLYVYRPLKNAEQVIAWAKGQGFETCLQPDDMHVTICYSKTPVDWTLFDPDPSVLIVSPAFDRDVLQFGKAAVLTFHSDALLARHEHFEAVGGASYDFDEYKPHVTLSWKDWVPVDSTYHGPLVFGPEVFEKIEDDWAADIVEKAEIDLISQLNDAVQNGGKVAIDLGASMTTSRLVSLGFLSQAQASGHSKYRVDEVLDDKTCPVCMQMNGMEFDVDQQYGRTLQALGTSDPAELASIAPWPELADVLGVDADELQGNGYGAPPYHPFCRGMMELVEDGDVQLTAPGVGGFGGDEDDLGGAAVDIGAGAAGHGGNEWNDDDVQQLGWDRFEVTDPHVFADIDAAFEEGDYDQAQEMIEAWKSKAVAKEDITEGPNVPKKKRRAQTPAGDAQDYDDIQQDSSNVSFDSGVSNDMNAPLDRDA